MYDVGVLCLCISDLILMPLEAYNYVIGPASHGTAVPVSSDLIGFQVSRNLELGLHPHP